MIFIESALGARLLAEAVIYQMYHLCFGSVIVNYGNLLGGGEGAVFPVLEYSFTMCIKSMQRVAP